MTLESFTSLPFADWLPILLAPVIGSFLGVVIRRLPMRHDFVLGRSACEACGGVLGMRDLIPVISYVVLGGRCRHCGQPIGRFHLWIEAAAFCVAVAAVLANTGLEDGTRVWLDCVLGWWLLVVSWIDFDHFELPDALTLPLLLGGLLVAAVDDPGGLYEHAAGAVMGFLSFEAVRRLYRRLRHREGLGEGDSRLAAAAGAWLGLAALPSLVLLAALGGLGFALYLMLLGRKPGAATAIPFGPFLSAALWILWLARPWLSDA